MDVLAGHFQNIISGEAVSESEAALKQMCNEPGGWVVAVDVVALEVVVAVDVVVVNVVVVDVVADVIVADIIVADIIVADVIVADIIVADVTVADIIVADIIVADIIVAVDVVAVDVVADIILADVIVADIIVADIIVADIIVADIIVADVTVADIIVADIIVADIIVADVIVADIIVADVIVADIIVADIIVADIIVADIIVAVDVVADIIVADVTVADIIVADIIVADIIVADVIVADIIVADIIVADIIVADIIVADVIVADIIVADIIVADIIVADIIVADIIPLLTPSPSPHTGYAVTLAQIALSTETDPSYRMLASVLTRQAIEGHWTVHSRWYHPDNTVLGKEDKATLRELLPVGLADDLPRIRGMTAAAIAIMASHDWPQDWPSVFDDLVGALASGEPKVVHGTLRCLEDFARTMKEDHMENAIPMLAEPLLAVFSNESGAYTARDQMRAIKIYSSCLATLFHVKRADPNAAVSILGDSLPHFIEGAHAVLSLPDSPEDDCGLKIEAIRLVNLVMLRYTTECAELVGPCLPLVWHSLESGTSPYTAALQDGLPPPPRDSDGNVMGFEHQLCSLFEAVNIMASRETFRPALESSLSDLVSIIIVYAQLTDAQLSVWEDDPIQFVEDEDEMSVKRHSVRLAAVDLLAELLLESQTGEAFCMQVVLSLARAAAAHLATADELDAAGQADNAWRLREAVFYVMGRSSPELLALLASGDLDFDIGGFLEHVLLPVLQTTDNPYLLGRALWLASLFAHAVPAELAVAFVNATHACLAEDAALPVRVSATKSALALAGKMPKAALAEYVPGLITSLVSLAQEIGATYERPTVDDADDDATANEYSTLANSRNPILSIILDALVMLTKVDGDATASVEATSSVAVLESLAAVAFEPVFARLYKFIGSTLSSTGSVAADNIPRGCGFVAAVADIFLALVTVAPEPMPDDMGSLLGALLVQALSSPDSSLMQVACKILRLYIAKAPQHMQAQLGPNGESAMELVLTFISRLVSDDISEDGASLVGALIITLIKRAPDAVSSIMGQMLDSLLQRLATARYSPFIQSLVSVFALLISTQGAADILDLAAGISVGSTNGLKVLMSQWLEHELEFTGKYVSRLSLTSLASMLAPMASAIQTLTVRQEVIDLDAPVRTRRSAKQAGVTTKDVPVPIAIIRVFIGHLDSLNDDIESGLLGDDEDDDLSDFDDDLYEAAGLVFRDADSGKSPFQPSDSYMLSDAWNLGLDYDGLDDDNDEEYKDDPLMQIKIGEYLTAFLQAFAGQDPETFNRIMGFFNSHERALVEMAFNGKFAGH
ncbi:viral protein TPX [Thecamonas trahens ATCC 50062]|uniref:Viral protein TPX n=1 Tax=Thecamonas trahens ATCC 50062 TaxID=461836 RepID=A0A0L0DNQ3_THETB|nr:viral protein TPX [Thecamonas trahens ATCC 50062]KNC53048.1 viral protein TPX [Thecamonas trahens ATCC 50062]|eukprot:XP_013754725.1 viral protein TPX [Thecamonas trahens ATCC 50062]